MAGISDKALKPNYAENKYRYNGGNELQNKEFSDGSGLEWYDATHRMYDPQIGRFGQLDELGEVTLGWSPYSFSYNNPVRFNDPFGLLSDSTHPQQLQTVVVTAKHTTQNLINTYWSLVNRGVDLSRIKDKGLRDWLVNYDNNQQWLYNLHVKQKEEEEEWLEYASWLIPIPALGELKIAGKLGNAALKLLSLKRGAAIVEAGSHLVYKGVDAAGVVRYIGITGRDLAEREAEHLAATGSGRELLQYTVIDGATGMAKTDARVLEQKLINEYGLGKNGGQLLNKINSIAEKNWSKFGITK